MCGCHGDNGGNLRAENMGFEKRDTATQDMHEAFCIKAYGYYWKIAIVDNVVYIKSVKLYGIYHQLSNYIAIAISNPII